LEHLHRHTISNTLFFERIYKVHHAQIWSCSDLGAHIWLIVGLVFLAFQLYSPIFSHNALNMIWITPSFNCRFFSMCVHTSHRPYGHSPHMLCSWQWTHGSPWCNSWHLCCHCVRCWLSHRTSKFSSSILCNSKIYCLRYSSNQINKLLQSTPHWSIPPFNNTQINLCVFTQLCQCHLILENAKMLLYFCLGFFFFGHKFWITF
jgi:hypothetical protein